MMNPQNVFTLLKGGIYIYCKGFKLLAKENVLDGRRLQKAMRQLNVVTSKNIFSKMT